MESKKKKTGRILALIGVIVILCMIIATFLVAVIPFPGSEKVFLGLLVLDIVLPVSLWIYMHIYQWAKKEDEQ